MQKLLTIYKFNFPFISEEFEKTRYNSILEDLGKLFLYTNELKSKKNISKNNFEITSFKLKKYKAEIIIYNNTKETKTSKYFIPRLEFNFYSESKINSKTTNIVKNIFEIFISVGSNNYIFDYEKKSINFTNSSQILTLDLLKKSFTEYNYDYLKTFIKNTPEGYIGEDLMTNTTLRNSFYYMIFLCFNFYNNLIKTENGENEVNLLLKNKNKIENSSVLKLSKTRLNIIEKDITINFTVYKEVLDKLFDILKRLS